MLNTEEKMINLNMKFNQFIEKAESGKDLHLAYRSDQNKFTVTTSPTNFNDRKLCVFSKIPVIKNTPQVKRYTEKVNQANSHITEAFISALSEKYGSDIQTKIKKNINIEALRP